MFYYVKPARKKPRTHKPPKMYHHEATIEQIAKRNQVIRLAKFYKGTSFENLRQKLTALGYIIADKRIYQKGGVGSWRWLPKLGVFRVQIRASHITTKGQYIPYALCVEV